MHDKTFLGKGSVLKLVIKLSIPTIIAQLVNLLYNIVDRIYIGNIPKVGGFAYTGVGVCMPVILLVSAFAALVGYGGAPKSTIYLGQKEDQKAEIVVGNSFTLLLILGILLTIILLIFYEPLLYLFGASENTIGFASDYLLIYAIGTIFVMMALGMNAFISAQGFTKISMLSVLIGAILNCILDPIFTSRARISYKTLVDLITAYNVTNSNKMQNIKEMGNLKKSIMDLKIKMDAKDKSSETLQMDEYGSQLFDQLFKSGRKTVIDQINEYSPAMDDTMIGQYSKPIDDVLNERLDSEANDAGSSFRTMEGSKYIQYENLQPELYVQKSFSTGDLDVVAVGNDGVVIDDYPVPSIEQLGKLTFNPEANTCTDQTGRVFKVMEVK